MPKLSRLHFVLAFVALMLLRVAVGFHFFQEGTTKLQGGFTAEYFLKGAKGPFAPYFQAMVDDADGALRLCRSVDPATENVSIDATLTLAIWDDFLDRAFEHFRFGDEEIEQQLIDRRAKLAKEIAAARQSQDRTVDTSKLEFERSADEASIKVVRRQEELAREILESHSEELENWLSRNQIELLAFFQTEDRLNGFDRDGPSREMVSQYVDSIREQVDTIAKERQKQLGQWTSEVETMWDSYESAITGLAIDQQRTGATPVLHRPFRQANSKLQWINRIIPWFDTIVGALLIIGLFTRIASFCAAVFLISVIAAQPPWIPGTESTMLYTIELAALIVIFATCAGRLGGMDFFFSGWSSAASTTTRATEIAQQTN